jgi:uncharacterized caspase-like protein
MSTRRGRVALAVMVWLAMFGSIGAAYADRRVALIIGNGAYQHAGELTNPPNDAKAISDLLTRAGFDVVDHRQDVGVLEFKRAVREFVEKAANADIAIIYYSGHGIEFDGVNYLIPVDASLTGALDVDDEAVSLDRLLTATSNTKKLSLIILDACRENPFPKGQDGRATRGVSMGLSSVAPTGSNTLIAYAAKAGSVSYDGSGANSPFTSALLKYLTQPGLDVRIAFGKVRDDVMTETGGKQEPFVYGSLGGDSVSIVPVKAVVAAAPASPQGGAVSEALDYEMAERVASLDAWHAFLIAHPTGYYAQLAKAQIAKATGATNVASLTLQSSAKTPQAATAAPAPVAASVSPAAPAPAPTQVARPAPTPPAQQVAKLDAAAPPPKEDDACKRDQAKLAQLRANPLPADANALAKDMTCEQLRPQLARVFESLGLTAPPPSAAVASPAAPKAEATPVVASCESETGELSRLRANPDLKSVQAFVSSLTCAPLKPQAMRLLESLAD